MFRRFGVVAVTLLAILFFANIVCQAQPQPFLTRHVPAVVANGKAQLVGHLPADQVMRFDIVMPLRDQTGLDIFLQQLYDPSSIFFHQFITPEEFTARFGPSDQDWETMVNFAKASGFQIFSGTRDERDLRVTGTVANVEKAFHLTLGIYQDPNENRTFFSPDREPSVDLPFALWHVSGLDSYIKKHSMLVNKHDYAKKHGMNPDEVIKPDATTGSCPSASFCASDMRAAYYGGTALTGTGQTVGLFEYEGTNLSDLALYYKNAGQTEPFVPTVISVDGTSTTSSDDIEQTLDMGQAMGMAPGLTMVYNYVGSTDTAILSAMVANVVAPISKQIGCSWGWTADVSTLNPYFEQMGTQDQNFFAASGDSGYWHGTGNSAPWPADDAYVVGVGGTDLTTSGAAGPWASEGGWTDSGGGITTNSVPIPSWQQLTGVINSSNAGSTTLRNGPDVSANANFTFYVCGGGSCTANEEGGTSFAAPMWAGYLALANQQAAANSESIGFINPIIYPANLTSSYSTYFHDISDGASNGKYKTVTGYDLLSGWGSPNGSGLINLLAPVAGGTTPQTITFTTNAPASAAYNSQFTVAATASSGLAVTFTSSGSCSNSGATYTMTSGSGTCSVIANQAGNSTYAAAPTVTQTTSATTGSQTITFTTNAPASAAYNANFTVAATASSGLAVAYTSSGSCTNSGATYTMTSGTGTCSVIANQAGNTNYSAAPTVTQTTSATAASQTITFTTNPPASAAYNAQFTVAATASSGLAVAYTSSGSCSNSGATYTMTSGTGTCSVIANQAGNTNYAAAAQVTKTASATLASQSITFTTNPPASAAYNSQFTVAATASSSLAVAYTSSGACSNSGATYTMTSGTGTCSVIANQAGNTNYSAAAQVTKTASATLASQSITFTTNPPASAAYNSQFTVAATASSSLAVAYTSSGACSNSGATYTMTSGAGTCSVIANQSGNTNYSAAAQVTKSVTATPASASVNVGSTLNPSSYGQAVSFTASVTGSSPTGTVQFTVDGGAFGSPVTLVSGSAASGSISTLTNGTHTVSATYSGDSNNSGSTGTLAGGQVVGAAGAGVSVASSVNPTTYGQSVTFTATISGANGLVRGRNSRKPMAVSGTVAWSSNTGCGTTTVTTGNPGTATCTTTSLPVGSDTITANYSGDSNHNSSSGTLNQTVDQVSANVSVGSTLNPSTYGQAVNFTTSVTGSSPTGTVQFNIDGSPFDTETLVSGSAASISTSTLTQGTHTVTAVYSGDTNNAGSTGTLSGGQVVSAAGAGVSVASSLNPSNFGQPVTFTATISGANGLVKGRKPMAVSGTVAWSTNTGCGTTAVASGNPGTATCTTTSLPVGTDTITATYSGDSNHSGGTGTLSGQVVNPSQTQTITFTTNAPSSAAYNSNFAVAATGGASGNPVVFTSSGACSNSGASYTMTSGTGTCSVIANQAGNSQYAAAPTVTETVSATQLSQAIAFTTNAPSSAAYNSSFTVAATGGASGNPVAFTSSGSCSNSGATYTMTSGAGTCSVIANQAGNANYSAASTVTQTTSATPASQTIAVTTPAPPTATYKSSFTVVASAGTAITFSSSGACTDVNGTYTITKTSGTCTVTMNAPASTNYLAAPPVIEQTQLAQPVAPTVSFTGAPASAPYGSSFTVVATTNASTTAAISASPASVCYIAGTTVTMVDGTGTCTLTATWAADDVYSSAKATQKTVASKLPSGLAWATPAPITHGTLLSSTQLDATASVPGTFVYVPAAGTEPRIPVSPATCDTLKVTFTPTQSNYYAKETASVCLVVTH